MRQTIIDKTDASDGRFDLDHKNLAVGSEFDNLEDKENEKNAESKNLPFGNGGDDIDSISSNIAPEDSTLVEVTRDSREGEQLMLLDKDTNGDEGPFNILSTIPPPPPLNKGSYPQKEGDNIGSEFCCKKSK